MAASLSAARRRPAGRGRDRLHPRGRPRHAVRVEPGRLHADLHLLPYRHAEAGAQSDRRGDRRPGHDRARPARRLSRRDAPDGAIVPPNGRLVSNIVMMGMGEPLYNFDNVKQALLIAADGDGLSLSKRRITLSTSGVVPMIARTGEEIGVMLAISLHAVRDELRDELVPLNKKYPIDRTARRLPRLSRPVQRAAHHLRICDAQGRERHSSPTRANWCGCCTGIPAKINLIPFNPWPGYGLRVLGLGDDRALLRHRQPAGYASPIRTPRGRDILAACGQLKIGIRTHEEDRPSCA